jgi:hypothetical protein
MKNLVQLLLAVVAVLVLCVVPVEATTISVASRTIQNWQYTTSNVQLRIYANKAFITSDGRPVLPGSPNGGNVYKTLTCTVVTDGAGGYTLTIPAFTLDSTTDAQDPPGMTATYSAWFYTTTGRQIAPFAGFESFRILPVYATNPTSWALIRNGGVWKSSAAYT